MKTQEFEEGLYDTKNKFLRLIKMPTQQVKKKINCQNLALAGHIWSKVEEKQKILETRKENIRMNFLSKINEQESWRRYWISGLLQEKEYQTTKSRQYQGSEKRRKMNPFKFNLKSSDKLQRPKSLTFKGFNRTREVPNKKFSQMIFGRDTVFLMPSRNKTLQTPQAVSFEGFEHQKDKKVYMKIGGGADKKNNFWVSRDIMSRTETNIQDVTEFNNNDSSHQIKRGSDMKLKPIRYLTKGAGNPFTNKISPRRYDTLH